MQVTGWVDLGWVLPEVRRTRTVKCCKHN